MVKSVTLIAILKSIQAQSMPTDEGVEIFCPKFQCLDDLYRNSKDPKDESAGQKRQQALYKQYFTTKNSCFNHDKNQPVQNILAIGCPYAAAKYGDLEEPVVCDFDLRSGKYAWINEETQHYSSEDDKKKLATQSQLFYKRTHSMCRESAWMEQQLLGGRQCTYSYQCVSGRCEFNSDKKLYLCTARKNKETCATHYDCDAGLFCST